MFYLVPLAGSVLPNAAFWEGGGVGVSVGYEPGTSLIDRSGGGLTCSHYARPDRNFRQKQSRLRQMRFEELRSRHRLYRGTRGLLQDPLPWHMRKAERAFYSARSMRRVSGRRVRGTAMMEAP
jgi:hypothetical protein